MSKNGGRVKTENGASDLETLLNNLDPNSADFQVDLEVGGESGSTGRDTPVDFSVSKDLVPLGGADSAESTASRQLARMSEYEFLDSATLRKKRIVYPEMDDFSIMNSFREIRTRLLQKSKNENFILIVVSVGQEQGSTFTTVNLGAAFSYEGERTALLVDCQPNSDNLGKLLELDNTPGLSDYFSNHDIDVGDIIYPTGVSRMRLIPFGTRNEAGPRFLTSERMKEFMGALKRRHKDRFIFINSPPLEASADAAILSDIADYILIVLPYGKVSKNRLNKAIKSLPSNKIAGVVMSECKRYA